MPTLVSAQGVVSPPPGASDAKRLDTVVVSGTLPGPGLWRVSRDGHALYILGTISPLPAKMEWVSTEVEDILSRTDEVIAPGGAAAQVGVGDVFKMSLLLRSARAAMKIPSRQRLEDVVPAAVYSQWQSLRAKYRIDVLGLERMRPVFASQDLYYAAISASGMTREDVVWTRIAAIAEDKRIPITPTTVRFPLDLDRKKYKAGIDALAESRVDDTTCFARTIEALEVDLEAMRQAANAWAVGDLEMLDMLGHDELKPACKETYDRLMGFQRRPAIEAEADAAWLAAATAALERNDVTFAVLPFTEIGGPDGMIERLRASGFEVEVPFGAAAASDRSGKAGP